MGVSLPFIMLVDYENNKIIRAIDVSDKEVSEINNLEVEISKKVELIKDIQDKRKMLRI
jgi:hypothetical protein